MSCHIFYWTILYFCHKILFQMFPDTHRKDIFFFHLPQSLFLLFFDGRGILEASMAFILVKRITGFFCRFCTDYMYFTSQKLSLHSTFLSASNQGTFMCFDFLFLFPLADTLLLHFKNQSVLKHYNFSNSLHLFDAFPHSKY